MWLIRRMFDDAAHVRATLINHEQVDIAEKIVAGLDDDAVLTHRLVPLVDGAGNAIVDPQTGRQSTITQSWSPGYVAEAFVTVIEGLLLAEAVQLVAPIWEGATVMPAYSCLVPGVSGFLDVAVHDPAADSGALDPALLESLDDGHDDSSVMFARAYNGRYGDVAVRLGPSDLAHLQEKMNRFSDEADAAERFSDSSVLTSDEIAEACEQLAAEYGVARASGSAIAPAWCCPRSWRRSSGGCRHVRTLTRSSATCWSCATRLSRCAAASESWWGSPMTPPARSPTPRS